MTRYSPRLAGPVCSSPYLSPDPAAPDPWQVLFNTKEMTQAATLPGGVWEYTNEYWNAREQKQWGEMPDLY